MILCGNRKVLFDNNTKDKEKQLRQVQQLVSLVNMVMSHNGGQPFTNELFKELKVKTFYIFFENIFWNILFIITNEFNTHCVGESNNARKPTKII